jgi:hypothetical protein
MPDDEDSNPMLSSDFAWNLDRPERTQELFDRYDVQKAKRIITESPRPLEVIDLKESGDFFRDYLEGVKLKQDVDWTNVDTDFPVIVARSENGLFLIDGRHRMAKALENELDGVPAVYLTAAETALIHSTVGDAEQRAAADGEHR